MKIEQDDSKLFNYEISDYEERNEDDESEAIVYYDVMEDENDENDLDTHLKHALEENYPDPDHTTYNPELDESESVQILEDVDHLDGFHEQQPHQDEGENCPEDFTGSNPRNQPNQLHNQTVEDVSQTLIELPASKKPRLVAVSNNFIEHEIVSSPTEAVALPMPMPEQPQLTTSVTAALNQNHQNPLDSVDANNEETYFALSLIGIFKRLPPQKRAVAKCNILRYLTELEYGSSAIL